MNEFLQSEEWLKFQEATGKEVVRISSDGFWANGIIHRLPFVGRYLYVPRGPRISIKYKVSSITYGIAGLIDLAKEKKVKWIRIEPESEELLKSIQEITDKKVAKAPHDVQPREVLRADISPSEEALFSAMKPKTRYNIRLAEKRGVTVIETREGKHIRAFLDLITATSGRKGITSHPRAYYEKFFQVLPKEMCRLFVAEYEGNVLAANMMIFYGGTATYLHGGSSDAHRDMMAPYLLQWEQMKFAKRAGCALYDFGGVRTEDRGYPPAGEAGKISDNGEIKADKKRSFITHHSSIITNPWEGITKFKTGFSPSTQTVVFPGAYDIILNPRIYATYRAAEYLNKKISQVKKLSTH